MSGYNYLRAGGRGGQIYLFDTSGSSFEALTVSTGHCSVSRYPRFSTDKNTGAIDRSTEQWCTSKWSKKVLVDKQETIWDQTPICKFIDVRRIGFDGDCPALVATLLTTPGFFFVTFDAVVSQCGEIWTLCYVCFQPTDLGTGGMGKITGLCSYGGAVVASSTDHSVKVGQNERIISRSKRVNWSEIKCSAV